MMLHEVLKEAFESRKHGKAVELTPVLREQPVSWIFWKFFTQGNTTREKETLVGSVKGTIHFFDLDGKQSREEWFVTLEERSANISVKRFKHLCVEEPKSLLEILTLL